MPCIKAILLASILLVADSFALHNHPLPRSEHKIPEDFRRQLEAVPEEILRNVLKDLPSYKEGIFEKHQKAIEAIHATDAAMATRLVVVARHDLYRRQNNGNISVPATPSPPPPSVTTSISSESSTSSSSTSELPPTALTITTSAPAASTSSSSSSTSETTTSTSSSSSSSMSVSTLSVSTLSVATTKSSGGDSGNGDPEEATYSLGATSRSNLPVSTLTRTNGQVTTTIGGQSGGTTNTRPVTLTTTNAQGSTFVTTFTPQGGVVSSIVLETTTLPDGTRSTITSYAIMPAATGAGQIGGPRLTGSATQSGTVTLSGILIAALTFGAFLL